MHTNSDTQNGVSDMIGLGVVMIMVVIFGIGIYQMYLDARDNELNE
jgi:hypothetical protein